MIMTRTEVKVRDETLKQLSRLAGDKCKAKDRAERLCTLTGNIDVAELEIEAEIFKAMAIPTRLAILKLLKEGELCVCEITSALAKPQSSTSHHLSILKSAGLIRERKEGKWSHYRISDGAVIELMNQAKLLCEG
jgi:DNA-binding transcriptional ArsR family regulator